MIRTICAVTALLFATGTLAQSINPISELETKYLQDQLIRIKSTSAFISGAQSEKHCDVAAVDICATRLYTDGNAVTVDGIPYNCSVTWDTVNVGGKGTNSTKPLFFVWILTPKNFGGDPSHKYRFSPMDGIQILDNDTSHQDFFAPGKFAGLEEFFVWKLKAQPAAKPAGSGLTKGQHQYFIRVQRTTVSDMNWAMPESCGAVDPLVTNEN